MLQPFVLLEQKHIDRLEKLGKHLLVSQRYHRGANHMQEDNDKIDLLLSDYSNRGLAETHKNAVKFNRAAVIAKTDEIIEGDPADNQYVAIIDLHNARHYQTLQQMLQGERYRLYWCIPENEERLKKIVKATYREKLFHYVVNELQWPMKGNDQMKIDIEVIFGRVFVNLKWKELKRQVELARIEQYKTGIDN